MLIEDYGLVGDLRAAALVGRNGSVDWLCLPRFDSPSCFSALLGDERHGRWLVAPADEVLTTTRRYRPDTLILDTDFETADGAVRVTDFMPPRGEGPPRFMRIVEGLRGRVPMRLELALRPDYGSITPWTELVPDGVMATAGADAFRLSTPRSARRGQRHGHRGVRRDRGSTRTLHPDMASRPIERRRRSRTPTRRWPAPRPGGGTGPSVRVRRRLPRRGDEVAHRAQSDDVRDDGRAGRGTHHLAAGGHRRCAQLGLPLLLAARLRARARRR